MNNPTAIDYNALDDTTLLQMEREIARKYMEGLSWKMVAWPFLNIGTWLTLWYLVFSGALSPWAAFPIAVINATLAYLPSHESQHDIYARPGEPLRWLNQFIGHFSLIPLAYSYRALRETHMEHHKNTNHPELDPDYHSAQGNTIWDSLRCSFETFQPDSPMNNSYGDCLQRLDTPEARLAIRDQVVITLAYHAFLFAMAMSGYALEVALLWWLPQKLALFYIRLYLSWLPHQPADKQGRYQDTHAFKSWGGSWSSLGMTAHIIHHLHPRIPLDRTPAALREMKPILLARGCKLAD